MRMLLLSKGLNHHRAGRLAEAERVYRQVLKSEPGHEDARRLLAVLKHQTGRSHEALRDLENLLQAHPLFPEAMANRGVVLAALGRPDDAEAQFRLVLDQASGFPDAFGPLLRLLLAQERLDDATALLDRTPGGWALERATLALKLGHFDQAEAGLNQALSQHPGSPELIGALVPVLTFMGRHHEAVEAGRAALALNPAMAGLRHSLAQALLGSGNLTEGWSEFVRRWEAPGFPSHPRQLNIPRWDGKSGLAGKTVLLWREQGIGDEISFASALPDLIAKAGQVIVECSAKLVPLFARSFPRALVRAENRLGDAQLSGIDVHLPMGDLFCFLRPNLGSFSAATAYLTADPAKTAQWKARLQALGPGPKIGLAWKSSLATPSRSHHYPGRLELLDPVLRQGGKIFVVVQPNADPSEIEAARQRTGARILHFPELDLLDDLEETAALFASLDLLVANGSANAFLAAALGVSTWLLMLRHGSWTVMDGERIPWLPSARLFHRAWNEGWEKPVHDLALALSGAPPGKAPAVQKSSAPPRATGGQTTARGAHSLLDQATAAHLAGRKAEAESLYRAVLGRDPEQVEALVNLAALQDESGRTPDAVALLTRAYRLRPSEAAIPDNLARMLIRQDRLEEAVPLLKAALKLEPGNAPLMNDLGNALRLLNRLDESANWLDQATRQAPGMMPARFNYAKTLRELGRCSEALGQLKAIAHPDRFTLWETGATCLQMGDLARGWAGIEYRPGGLARQSPPDCRNKTVFVRTEQGVGDVLIYGSALPDLLNQAGRVILEAPLKLHALLARSFPRLVLIAEGEKPPVHDLALPLGSLFYLFRPALAHFQTSKSFLKADPAKTAFWKLRLDALGPGFKLGLAWRSTQVTRERARHFPGQPARLDGLLNLPGVIPVSLQAQARPDELTGLRFLADCDLFDDLDNTAALIAALDAVVANGSAIGILAGALGGPTGLLMRAHATWVRLGTDHLPWLSAAKLFDCAWNEPWETAALRAADWVKTLLPHNNA